MEKQNIPVLRFAEFQGNWTISQLGDLLEFKNGINASKDQYGSGYKFINVLDILNNDFITHDKIVGSVNVEQRIVDKYPVDYGDILFQRSSETREEVGTASVYLDKKHTATFGGFVIRGRKTGEYEPVYLNYLLKTDLSRNQITSKSGGSTRYNVGQGILSSIKLPFPTLPEQQKIAAFLTTVDSKLQGLKKKKELLEQYKKGVMQKLFSQALRFKPARPLGGDESGNPYPNWEKKKLGEIAERKTRKNKDNSINNVFTNSASQGIVNQRDFFDKDIANQSNLLNYYVIEKNDFIYNPRISNLAPVGPIGRNHLETGVMSPLYSVFQIMEGNLDFLEYFFATTYWHEYLNSIANFGARFDRMNITTKDFYLMPIPFPCTEEQTKIANFLTAIDQKIAQVNTQLTQTQTWKKGLLQKMFV